MAPPVLRLKVVRKPLIKAKMDVRFPANVAVDEFLTVVKANGTYTFGVDYTLLGPGSFSDPTLAMVAVLDRVTGAYKTVTLADILASLDPDLNAIAALTGAGLLARTGTNTWSLRSTIAPAAGITVSNGDGVAGNPTLVLANDLAALEGLSGTGIARRTGTDAWSVGTAVTNSELATMLNNTFKGNVSGSTAVPSDLTAAQVAAALPLVTTSAKGLAPTLPNDATKYLDGTGAYSIPPGGVTQVFATVAAYQAATVTLADDTPIYIANYYAGTDGGGHWCRIKSVAPSHPAYHTSANGKYAVLAEVNPNFRQFGANTDGSDCAPYWNIWLKYCAATAWVSSLHIPTGNWIFSTRPDPIMTSQLPWGRTITGDGLQNTILYASYSTGAFFGMIHLLPNANGGGLVVKDLQIISQRTDFSSGAAIATHDGYVKTMTVGGTITTGNVLTATVGGTAVNYTVLAGDTKQSIAYAMATAINANSTIFNTIFAIAIPCDDKIVLISKVSAPATLTTGTTGATTLTAATVGQQTTGYIVLERLNVTANNGWSFSVYFDGRREDLSPLGVRDVSISGCNFFGGQVASAAFYTTNGLSVVNSACIQAGGTSGTLILDGLSGNPIQNFSWSGNAINDIAFGWAAFGTINVGKILGNVVNGSNTDHIKVMTGNIVGTAQTNWTNSAYVT